MYVGNEMNQSNASKILAKIKNPWSIVEMWFLGFEKYENLDEKIEKMEKIDGKWLYYKDL